ncbi:MAG: alpha/beta hydrolase family protein [Myxococcota bacterium]|nr:alpha/beta hydrolase family protein [Myxococcota bacterium]
MTHSKLPSWPVWREAAFSALVALLFIAWSAPAAHSGPLKRRGKHEGSVERVVFYSTSLDADEKYRIYLPPGYATSGGRRYPVVYLLHGLQGTDRDFFVYGELHKTLDRLIQSGTIQPMIVVGANGGESYWSNHIGTAANPGPKYRDYIVKDLVSTIDRRYRTRASGQYRAIAGVSMGGYGALSVALENPNDFAAGVSLSGALFLEAPSHRKVYLKVWGDPPNPGYFNKTSPIHLMRNLPEGSRSPGIYLHCGDRDSLGFLKYALEAHKILKSRRVPHALRVTGGGHTWDVWGGQAPDWLRWVDKKFKRN